MDRRRKILLGTGIVTLVWLMLFAGVIGGVAGYLLASKIGANLPKTFTTAAGKTVQVTSEESAVINVAQVSAPAVVSIVVKGVDPFSGNLAEQGAGTGFIVDASGVVVTNSHVVDSADSIYTVVTKDKKTYAATKISRDPINDVAVLRISGSNFPHLSFGDSQAIKVGQSVVAIGNALGKFDNTVTTGVVSGVGRRITASDQLGGNSESLEGLIQTDAAINPGNSGGPLLNLAGEVIGIDTAAASSAQNIGFAVPSNTAQTVLTNYLKNGKIIRPFLGVGTASIAKDTAILNNIPEGALVRTVQAGSAADKAGLKKNDVITQVGSQVVNEVSSLAKAISSRQVGEVVTIKIWRGGENLSLTATLTEAP